MRRIYESDALRRDDEPFSPNERSDDARPRAVRSVDGAALSDRLLPHWLRRRAISVDVSTPRDAYPAGEDVPFQVSMTNALPVPIAVTTRSPLLWTWTVDGQTEASRRSRYDPPDEPGRFQFGRSERKRFRKRWHQNFRVSDSEWEPAEPGEYTIGAGLNVPDAAENGLYDETAVRVLPE